MENVLLIIHLILALILIGAVLLQRSEGGGLGVGGDNNFMANRSATTAVNKLTWIIATLFFITSLTLTIIAANESSNQSILDNNNMDEVEAEVPLGTPGLNELKALPKKEESSAPPKEY
ncbi:MAG: preprotein translocase subunit SecG [Paracoccaceae bacterium]